MTTTVPQSQNSVFQVLKQRWEPSTASFATKADVSDDIIAAVQSTGVPMPANIRSVLGNLVLTLCREAGVSVPVHGVPSNSWPLSRRAAQPSSPATPQRWPPSLREYATRSFTACGADEKARADTERALESAINAAIADGTLWVIDWAARPDPIASPGSATRPKRKFEYAVAPSSPSPIPQQTDAHGLRNWLRRDCTASVKTKTDVAGAGAAGEEGDEERIRKRAIRFGSSLSASRTPTPPRPLSRNATQDVSLDAGPVTGTSRNLEKQYLRLTSAPDPAAVRPEPVLRQALQLVKNKLARGGEYSAACEQFKSIRQDLTVQHLRDDFAVEVYETHGRVALEQGDFGEFNQCQTQLFSLYESVPEASRNRCEFAAYRILYYLLIGRPDGITKSIVDLNQESRASPEVRTAMDLRRAAMIGDYHEFFRIVPRWNRKSALPLIAEIGKKVRDQAFRVIVKSYRPTVPVSHVQKELGFTGTRGMSECLEFLRGYGARLIRGADQEVEIDTKTTAPNVSVTPPPSVSPTVF